MYRPELGYETRRHQSGKSFSTSKVGKRYTIESRTWLYTTNVAGAVQTEMQIAEAGVAPIDSKDNITQEPQPQYQCEICKKEFTSDRALITHIKSHEAETGEEF